MSRRIGRRPIEIFGFSLRKARREKILPARAGKQGIGNIANPFRKLTVLIL